MSLSGCTGGWSCEPTQLACAAEPAPGAYARALEKIYEANLVPLVISSRHHRYPELYDRLVDAGAPPAYPATCRSAAMALVLGILDRACRHDGGLRRHGLARRRRRELVTLRTPWVRLQPDLRLIVVFRSAKDPILSRSERRPWDVRLKPDLHRVTQSCG